MYVHRIEEGPARPWPDLVGVAVATANVHTGRPHGDALVVEEVDLEELDQNPDESHVDNCKYDRR